MEISNYNVLLEIFTMDLFDKLCNYYKDFNLFLYIKPTYISSRSGTD